METTDKISYSFKERYFNLEKEKRIWKRQFQTRVFVPGILLFLPIMILSGILGGIVLAIVRFSLGEINPFLSMFLAMIMSMFLYYGVSLFFLPTLIKKRCHDFWSSGIIETKLFVGGFILFLLVALLLIWELFWFIPEIIPTDFLFWVRDYIRYGIIILGLYLMLRPGNKWSNSYWEDTTNVKIGFLG